MRGKKQGVCACEKKGILQDGETDRDKNAIDFFQFRAGFYMHTLSREALLADKVRWGSGADPSHSDD